MDLFKIKGSSDGKIYKLVDTYDVTKDRYELGVDLTIETYYILVNIADENEEIKVPISQTLLHE